MLNRTKLMLSTLALCSGFCVAANAQEVDTATSGADNSVVILACAPIGDSGLASITFGYQVVLLDPPDFTAVSITPADFDDWEPGDDCAVSVAKLNKAGWRTEFWGFEAEVLGYLLKKQ